MVAADFITQIKSAISEITDPAVSPASVDINTCDREAIHIPAAIQPYGVLLVFDEPDGKILQVSQNIEAVLGQPPADLLQQPLSRLFSEKQLQLLRGCLAEEFEAVNPLHFALTTPVGIKSFSGVVHRSESVVILELEPSDAETGVNFFDFHSLVKRPVRQIQQTQTLDELCQTVVEAVKQISGFDRVMVYRFDESGAGSVIAEAKNDTLQPYLGLHYPATDIPKQAKYLYTLNLVRLIPDVAYEPVPLVPAVLPDSGAPLDMSLSVLRSVSPLHSEYLTNMGVKASMSISLVHNQQLWGLIACHHNQPRLLSYELRTVCEFLGQIASLELANRQESEDADYRMGIRALQADFVRVLTDSKSPREGLTQNGGRLLSLVGASGAAFYEQGDVTLFGVTPDTQAVLQLAQWLSGQFQDDVVYHTNCLSDRYAAADEFKGVGSGLLAMAISQVQEIYVIWFRPEVLQTVDWAGNPNKPKQVDEAGQEYISPRQSFEKWKETVRRQSLPWKQCEIEAALELRTTVIGLVLQRADELAELNTELERSNVELDAFAYFASHDLKEPLRGIHNYSSFLIEDYSDKLGDDGVNKLETLMRLTQRMEDLINSLLYYSRLGRTELNKYPTNLNHIVQGVIDIIRIGKQESIRFDVPESLPTVECDRTLITELYTNLISNAVKYNDKSEICIEIGYLAPPELEKTDLISDRELPEDVGVFYVRDNGIGIPEKHLETVFKIFKRLHSPKRYGGGTGAGLTIVKKIVEHHGGRIWVDSVLGEGSTFYFTL
ncbi:MAG: ATP-binding protein [Leptolyngbyaceae cyanobacterium]